MSAKPSSVRRDPGYTGLTAAVETLPAHYYFDAEHYQRELKAIWQRNWIYVCRASALSIRSQGTESKKALTSKSTTQSFLQHRSRHTLTASIGDRPGR